MSAFGGKAEKATTFPDPVVAPRCNRRKNKLDHAEFLARLAEENNKNGSANRATKRTWLMTDEQTNNGGACDLITTGYVSSAPKVLATLDALNGCRRHPVVARPI
jgi:hypothetical protein